jgi:hypothetical protein
MKIKLDRIISLATLAASLVAIVLVLKKPAPVARPQSAAAVAANAQSFGEKLDQLEQASQQTPSAAGAIDQTSPSNQPSAQQAAPSQTASSNEKPSAQSKAEVHINSDEVAAALSQALGVAGTSELTPDSNLGGGAPAIKDQQVSFEGDVVHGQFLTEIAGKDVWVTVSGHLASKDGYATFEPTEFKVGDLSVPISLVNPALQKKMAEQKDRLKLPDFVGDLKVQNGELVMQQK